ncbi:M6dom_TIGR03296, M6 family metalloprotease domain [Microbacteriaceae bacterium]
MTKSTTVLCAASIAVSLLLSSCTAADPATNLEQPSALPATQPTVYLSDAALFAEHEKCRIIDGDPALTNMTIGFPIPKGRIDLRKGANVHIVGVDFPDKPGGKGSPQSQNEIYTEAIQSFYEAQSSVPLNFTWNWAPDWITMPKSIKDYGLGGSFFEGRFNGSAYSSLARTVIKEVDAKIDFTGANFLFIVFPPGLTSEEIGTFLVDTQNNFGTDEGEILNLIMAGGDYVDTDTYIHEFAHGLGLTDIRDTTDLGNQNSDGMFYDMMNNPTYPELLVWHRFLLGFLENNQLHCKTNSEASTHWLVPVASESEGTKGVVVPINETEALIVESRQPIGYDNRLAGADNLIGSVVYTLDSKVPYRRTPVKVVEVLKTGESVEVMGYRFSLVESGTYGDVVKIEKLG